MSIPLRIIFAGTSDFAAYHLEILLSYDCKIVGILTQPDRPAGRGKQIKQNPVKLLAKTNNLSVFQPNSLFLQEVQQLITRMNADIMVVVSYGLIIPKKVIEMFRFGCINVHCSLLPRWRGAAPVQCALLAGDTETGVTIIKINAGIDTGDILYQLSCPIYPNDTSKTLQNKLVKLGQTSLIQILYKLCDGSLTSEKQDDTKVTYAKKLNKKDARINWFLPAIYLERCIRAFNPWPISWLEIIGYPPIKVYKATVIQTSLQIKPGTIVDVSKHGIQVATSENILNLQSLQPAGKKYMHVQDFLNSRREWFIPGYQLI